MRTRTIWYIAVILLWLLFATRSDVAAEQPYDKTTAWRALHFCKAAYCSPDYIRSWTCGTACAENRNVTVVKVYDDTALETLCYIGLDTVHQEVIVAFRGSTNIANFIVDALFLKEDYDEHECPGCRVHTGFHKAYKSVRTDITTTVDALLAAHVDYSLFITGHSLGGAMATLCAVDLAARMAHAAGSQPQTRTAPIALYTLESPRVGNAAFSEWSASLMKQHTPPAVHYRLTHGNDPVVHLPPIIANYQHVPTEVFYPKVDNPSVDSPYRLCSESSSGGEDPACSRNVVPYNLLDHVFFMGTCFLCSCVLGSDDMADLSLTAKSLEPLLRHYNRMEVGDARYAYADVIAALSDGKEVDLDTLLKYYSMLEKEAAEDNKAIYTI